MSLQHIGNYRIGKTLGVGSFGKVKLAEHERTGRKCAVKIHNRAKIRQQQLEDKVKREIKILKMCMHPHIIRLYEVIETPSDVYVFIEYSSGGELFDYIVERGRLTEPEARRFFQQLLVGVEYCHSNMIAHRDLKPENLLLDDKCNIKIADFGLSNCMRDGWFLKTSCGSPNYAAPEVISGKLYAGPEVDVWSCGVILYALLCGTLPFDDESIPFLFKKIKGGIYILPSYLSDQSKHLIGRMLVTDPLNRITTAEIRQHPWFRENLPAYLAIPPKVGRELFNVDEQLVRNVAALMQYPPEKILKDIRKGRRNQFTAGYHLMKDANLRLDHNTTTTSTTHSISSSSANPHITSPLTENSAKTNTTTTTTNNNNAHPLPITDHHLNGERRPSKTETPDPGSGPAPVDMAISPRTNTNIIPSKYPPTHMDLHNNINSMNDMHHSHTHSIPEMTREWTAGIRLRQHNANEAMMELYRALNDLKWKWKTPVSHSFLIRALIENEVFEEQNTTPVRLALQLYKAPSGIGYILDIQRIQGDVLAYFANCADLLRTLHV